jgi:excisionase family DNA binding protein
MTERWLSPAQAARFLGVSTRTLRRWEEDGRLHPARTRSGHRRYQLTELEPELVQHDGPSSGWARVPR